MSEFGDWMHDQYDDDFETAIEVYSDLERLVGERIYNEKYADQGGIWSAVNPDHKPVWYEKGRKLLNFIDDFNRSLEEQD